MQIIQFFFLEKNIYSSSQTIEETGSANKHIHYKVNNKCDVTEYNWMQML